MDSYGLECVSDLGRDLEYHKKKMNSLLRTKIGENKITSVMLEEIKRFLLEKSELPIPKSGDFKSVFRTLEVSSLNIIDVLALYKILGVRAINLESRLAALHNPNRYKIMKEIYSLLRQKGSLNELDDIEFYVGRDEVEDISFSYETVGDRHYYESENYLIKESPLPFKAGCKNYSEVDLWLSFHHWILCPIEMIFPRHNMIVFPKTTPFMSTIEIKERLGEVLSSGKSLPKAFNVFMKEKDWRLLERTPLLLNYWNHKIG